MRRGRPQDAAEFDPAEFAGVFEIAVRAGESAQSDESGIVDVELTGDDGLPVRLADTPYKRAGIALKRHYHDDEDRFLAALFRFRALMELISRNALGRWMRTSIRREGASRIHPAVLDVASHMRLSRNGKFAVNKFLEAVEEISRARYAGLPEWPLDDGDGASAGGADRQRGDV
ncbi:MAG: hypothetical protein R3174_13285 [Gammaproteobacteria bacterium]|nr:hypothetical protein [Gammaproteobacteria bacterium]